MAIRDRIVSLTLKVKNLLSPGAEEASDSVTELTNETRQLEDALNKLEDSRRAAKGLDTARQAASEAEKAFEDARIKVRELEREAKGSKDLGIAVQLDKAKAAASQAKSEWRSASKEVDKLERSVRRAGGSTDDLAAAEAKIAAQADKLRGKYRDVATELDRVKNRQEAAARSSTLLGAGFKGLVTRIGGLVAAYASLEGLRNLFLSVLQTGDKFERLQRQLEGVMGSIEAGREAADWIQEFTKTTPLQLQETTDAFITLKNFGIDPTSGAMQAIVDTASRLGGGQEKLQGVLLALGQAWAKQKLQSEEALQLMERGVPVWDLLAKATGKSTVQLQEMATAGKLGRDEIAQLIEEMGKANAGAAADQMTTLTGRVSNLKDRVAEFLDTVADAGLLDYAKQKVSEFSDAIKTAAEDGSLQRAAENISTAFILTGRTLQGIAATVRITWNALTATLGTSYSIVLDAISALTRGLAQAADTLGFDDLAARMRTASGEIQGISLSLKDGVKEDLADIKTAADSLGEAVSGSSKKGFADAEKASQKAKEKISNDAEQIAEKLTDVEKAGEKAGAGIEKGLGDALKKLGLELDGARGGLKDIEAESVRAFETIIRDVEATGRSAKDSGKIIEQSFKAALSKVKTEVGRSGIGRALQEAVSEGVISADLYNRLQQELSGELRNTGEEADRTADAIRRLNRELAGGGDELEDTQEQLEETDKKVQSTGAGMAAVINGITSNIASLSSAALAKFQALSGGMQAPQTEAERLKQKIQDIDEAIGKSKMSSARSMDVAGIGSALRQIGQRASEVSKQFYEQKLQLSELMNGYNSGRIGLEGFVAAAKQAESSLNLLDDADLSALRGAIEQAEGQLNSLRDSALGTLEGLQNELDRMRGNTQAVERRNYEQRQRELEVKLAAAQESGDAKAIKDLQESLRLAEQIYAVKTQQLADEERARKKKPAQAAEPAPATATPTSPQKIIRLESGGQAVDIATDDEDSLLDILANAGMRTSH